MLWLLLVVRLCSAIVYKSQNGNMLNVFLRALKLREITASLIFHHWKAKENTLFLFNC